MSARPAFRRPVVQSASRSGSIVPAMSVARTARLLKVWVGGLERGDPAMSVARTARLLAPRMSVTTRVSFTFGVLRVSSAAVACVARSQQRVACGSASGRAVPESGPAARSCPTSARAPTGRRSRSASFWSLLRPGTLRIRRALASTSVTTTPRLRGCATPASSTRRSPP